jgi:monoamine oxidase
VITRRAAVAAAAVPWVAGCTPKQAALPGGFTGASATRGHLLRNAASAPQPSSTKRTRVVIAGGGIAGLAAARALRLAGMDDFAVLELEDQPGGNSRAGELAGIACPLGAHYLPVPGDAARDVQDFLEEQGVRRRIAGRWTYDERYLCHSPQERLYFNGQWQEGVLPLRDVEERTLAQYRRFADLVQEADRTARFAIPSSMQARAVQHLALDSLTLLAFLQRHGLDDAHLHWYLDYCCRDDYGCGIAAVSAWAGIHYFASRHGFHPPGREEGGRDALLTWPEGNGWLAARLAAPLAGRVHAGSLVTRIEAGRGGVQVDALDAASGAVTRWEAQHCIVALPAFIAARVVAGAPAFVREAAGRTRYAPWLVANIHLREPLQDRPGAPPSWDNVVHGSRGLGYVDARHQALSPVRGATVLSWYEALGDLPDGRRQLMEKPFGQWQREVLAELAQPHPDLHAKATRMEIARYGHAMAVPVPGTLVALPPRAALAPPSSRLSYAHSDWAGYSIFEEAFTLGTHIGRSFSR